MDHGSVGCSLEIKILEQCLMNWWSILILFMSLVDVDKRMLLILLIKMAMLWYLGLSGDKDFRTVQDQRHLHWHLAKVPRRYRAHLFALLSRARLFLHTFYLHIVGVPLCTWFGMPLWKLFFHLNKHKDIMKIGCFKGHKLFIYFNIA